MNTLAYAVLSGLIIVVCGSTSAQQRKTATLHITVEKLSYGEAAPRPFQGVGTFDLFRGSSKLDGARCPDKSGPNGRVVCTIPCSADDAVVMVVRVKPPSDQDVLAGWVTPAGRDVEVIRCAVRPATLSMTYEDAKLALNKLLSKQYFAAGMSDGGAIADGGWIGQISGNTPLTTVLGEQAKTASGRAQLIKLHNLATEASSAPSLQTSDLSAEDKALAESLAQWQVLSKSALLRVQIQQALSGESWRQRLLPPTTDLATYRANLDAADLLLKGNSSSAFQIKLADDVKTLKSVPSIGKDAAAADKVIRTWQ